MSVSDDAVLGEVQCVLDELVAGASTKSIAVKLRNLNNACRVIVVDTKQRLTVPEVLRPYLGRDVL